jgi:hypothetical protein
MDRAHDDPASVYVYPSPRRAPCADARTARRTHAAPIDLQHMRANPTVPCRRNPSSDLRR